MQSLLSLMVFISVSVSTVTDYHDVQTSQMGLSSTDDAEWIVVRKSCWHDVVDGVRALDHAAENFDASWTTPAKCRAACEAEGYALAAVEYGHECWCGNTVAGHAYPVDDAYCNEPCSGDERQTCGGFGYMNLWAQKGCDFLNPGKKFDSSYLWEAVSCYKDVDANHRLLPFQPSHGIEPERMRTVEGCINACQGHGYDYAGLEHGAECWCGGTCPSEHLKGGKCDMPCKGNGKQYCGGRNSLLVYRRNGITEQKGPVSPARRFSSNDSQATVSGPVQVFKNLVKLSAAVLRQAGIPR